MNTVIQCLNYSYTYFGDLTFRKNASWWFQRCRSSGSWRQNKAIKGFACLPLL